LIVVAKPYADELAGIQTTAIPDALDYSCRHDTAAQ
jgi:hypothetical protein